MDAKIVNHWGKWVNSEKPVTGVMSIHNIAWEFMDDEICLICEEIQEEIESDESLSEDEKEHELEFIECDSSHDKIIGDWMKDKDGLYTPDESKEFAAIMRETVIQVVWSKYTARGALCSPCYPGQVDLDSEGDFLGYTLPSELIYTV
jgi:hypothetical protein